MAIIKCPRCGRSVSSRSGFCAYCNCEFDICPECGAIVSDDNAVCPECGFKLVKQKQIGFVPEPKKEKEKEKEAERNLIEEKPFRYDFSDGVKGFFNTVIGWGEVAGIIIWIVAAVIFTAACADNTDDPIELIIKMNELADKCDTAKGLVWIGALLMWSETVYNIIKDAYVKIGWGQWLGKRRETALNIFIKYEKSTATEKEIENIKDYTNAVYHAFNTSENFYTVINAIVRVVLATFYLIGISVIASNAVDYIALSVVNDWNNIEFDYVKNLPVKNIVIAVIAWVSYTFYKKIYDRLYSKRLNGWRREVGFIDGEL